MSLPLVELAKNKVVSYLQEGGVAVDATMGNGFDTAFMSNALAKNGRVYAFDIQQKALKATEVRLKEANLSNYQLILDSHENMAHHLEVDNVTTICCAMFNLGYLPGSDKSRQTSSKATLKALASCLSMLQAPGVISIIAYTGHTGGAEETALVKKWANSLSKEQYRVSIEIPTTLRNSPPELILIETV